MCAYGPGYLSSILPKWFMPPFLCLGAICCHASLSAHFSLLEFMYRQLCTILPPHPPGEHTAFSFCPELL